MKKGNSFYTKIFIIIGIVIASILVIIMFTGNDKQEEIKEETKIIVNSNVLTISKGNSLKINAYVNDNPNARLTWSSNNQNICYVNSEGLIVGREYGTTTVTIFYTDSNNKVYTSLITIKVADGNKDIALQNVKFQDGDIVIKVGDKIDLPVTFTPQNGYLENISYSVDNAYCDVENGILTLNSKGNCTITLSANDNHFTDTINVYGTDKDIISSIYTLPEEVIINEKNITLIEDEEYKINYSVNPSNSFNNVDVSIDNSNLTFDANTNKIKAVKEGNSIVTLTTINGKTNSFNVTIKPKTINVESVTVTSNRNLTINVGDKSKIEYKIEPSNASNKKLSFSSSDTSICTIDNEENIVGMKAGTCIIKVSSDNGKYSTVNVTVKSKSGSSCEPTIPSSSGLSPLTPITTIEQYNSCRSVSPNLELVINGTNYGQDSQHTIRVGETLTVRVNLPKHCGGILRLTRTSHDGGSNWNNYVTQSSTPYVDRCDASTFRNVTYYTWKITAKQTTSGYITLSQTAQFTVRSPSGDGGIKSMIRLKLKITN